VAESPLAAASSCVEQAKSMPGWELKDCDAMSESQNMKASDWNIQHDPSQHDGLTKLINRKLVYESSSPVLGKN
jgi:hypothetical protein